MADWIDRLSRGLEQDGRWLFDVRQSSDDNLDLVFRTLLWLQHNADRVLQCD